MHFFSGKRLNSYFVETHEGKGPNDQATGHQNSLLNHQEGEGSFKPRTLAW